MQLFEIFMVHGYKCLVWPRVHTKPTMLFMVYHSWL